jgi:hypothetical protein
MANAGGAWDNAKKVVETELRAKGTPLHDACVVGDTVGDPFKDTSSVALNPIIKFTTLFGILAVSLAVDLTKKTQGSARARPHPASRPVFHRRKRHRRAVLYLRLHRHAQGRDALAPHALSARHLRRQRFQRRYGVELHTIPLFHANGWGRPQACTMMGIKPGDGPRFDSAHVLRLIEEERATSMSLVPTMANACC